MLKTVQEAYEWFRKKYGGKNLDTFINTANVNFYGRVVGYIHDLPPVGKFLITWRPRGITFAMKGIGAMTGMNESEINYQERRKIDRIVIFQMEDGKLYPLVFRTHKIIEAIEEQVARAKRRFKYATPESETVWNIPLKLGESLDKLLEGDTQKRLT